MPTATSHQNITLAPGQHRSPENGVCVMELASMLAGERFSDRPQCVCPIVAALLRTCNDRFGRRDRQRLYRYAAEAVGTRGDHELERRRIAVCIAGVQRYERRHRWLSGASPRPPEGSSDEAIELFANSVVRAVGRRSRRPVDDLLALVDEVIAVGPTAGDDDAIRAHQTRARALEHAGAA